MAQSPPVLTRGTVIRRLNDSMPAAKKAKLGHAIDDLITNFNALLAKLDLDAGVTDTTYTSLLGVVAIDQRQNKKYPNIV